MGGTLDKELYWADETRTGMLQLHDEHTLWKVGNDALADDAGLETYWFIVQGLCEMFKESTGVEVGCYGRSSRHVCVEDTPMNRLNFHRLKAYALLLEAECVAEANAWRPEDE